MKFGGLGQGHVLIRMLSYIAIHLSLVVAGLKVFAAIFVYLKSQNYKAWRWILLLSSLVRSCIAKNVKTIVS